jgi:hypothetical protein
MDVDQHMVVLTRHLHEALGHLMTIDTISHAVTRSGDPFPMPKLGPGATGVSLRGHGWGRWLERVDKRILAGIDRSLDPETSAAAAIAMFQKDIDRMTAAHEAAVAAGLERPLEGEEILSTAHLVADADTLRVLIGMCGSALAARTWLTEQMAIHAMQVAAKRSTRGEGQIIHVEHATLEIPFRLPPLRIDEQRVDIAPGEVSWSGDVVRVGGALPETVQALVVGRPFETIVEGTPLGRRTVARVDVQEVGGVEDMLVRLEPDMVRIDAVLPPPR